MVFVLAQNGQPLMPTQRHGNVRRMLKSGQAQVVTTHPFTIQLTYETSHYTQGIILGIDSGYQHVGFSAITEKAEVVTGELHLLKGQRTRNKNKNTENLQKYRGEKLSPGRVSIRKRRYSYQPGDTVLYKGQRCTVKGVQNLGAYIKLAELRKPVKISEVRVLNYGKGLHICASENKSY